MPCPSDLKHTPTPPTSTSFRRVLAKACPRDWRQMFPPVKDYLADGRVKLEPIETIRPVPPQRMTHRFEAFYIGPNAERFGAYAQGAANRGVPAELFSIAAVVACIEATSQLVACACGLDVNLDQVRVSINVDRDAVASDAIDHILNAYRHVLPWVEIEIYESAKTGAEVERLLQLHADFPDLCLVLDDVNALDPAVRRRLHGIARGGSKVDWTSFQAGARERRYHPEGFIDGLVALAQGKPITIEGIETAGQLTSLNRWPADGPPLRVQGFYIDAQPPWTRILRSLAAEGHPNGYAIDPTASGDDEPM